ncbi:hypothetical protein FACS189454_07820 [Planctomycetales bacterium]|nr:hypothetical protein FACS189454_07820 [Planctomycetales bacterium]
MAIFQEETISVNRNDRVNGYLPQKISRSSWAWGPELESQCTETSQKVSIQKFLIDMIMTPQSLGIK